MIDYSYEILDLLEKYKGDVQAALEGEKSPECLYAFSPLRENLLEWAEFEPGCRILEIGSDYGSVTGLLAKKAGEVVVLDRRDENLEVNRLRHGERENVFYVRGNLPGEEAGGENAVPASGGAGRVFSEYKGRGADAAAERMGKPFDYVILTGFLGRHKKESAREILSWAAGFLRPGGTLFAAAENEAGVRYQMGAKHREVSFLEAEFRGLFSWLSGKFGGSFLLYYPVPDYRYPAAIYSDEYLPKTGDVTNISKRFDGPGFLFGSEEEAMAKACQNGIFAKSANSFLGVWEKGSL